MSKTNAVLKRLKKAGERGVMSFDLLPVGGFRYAARINDLRKKGHVILSFPEKRNKTTGCRYVLAD